MSPKGWILVGCGVVIAGGIFARMWFDVPSDKVLIRQAIEEASRNSKEGKPGGVLDYLSGTFTIQGFSPSEGDIRQFIRERKPEVEVLNMEPTIRGDQAEIVTPVNLKLGVGNLGFNQTVNGVKITLRRESGFRYGIFPTPRWKIVTVSAEDATLGNPFGL